MNAVRKGTLAFLLLAPSVAALAQQPDPLTQFEVKGHVYEPQPIAPTDERIAQLSLPSGFHIHRFAEGLDNPRMLAVANDGSIYVTQRRPGTLLMLQDIDRDGIVDVQRIVARIKQLHGIEIRDRRIYLVDVKRVYAAELRQDGTLGRLEVVARGLPDGGQHPNRTLRLGADGRLYVSVGSTCNACAETNPENATLLRMDPITGTREIFASGLRNTIGFDWHPGTGRLFGMDQGIDWLGDEEQTEELNEIVGGTRYGWPYVYDDDQLNPQDEPEHVTQLRWADLSASPLAGYTAHAASMEMRFYDGASFPADYRSSAFVAMHGSWNRKPASGYEVVRAVFTGSGDFVGFEPFVTGFLQPQPNRAPTLPGAQRLPRDGFIGRPTGIAIAQDGALLVGDDSNNVIYRVVYGAPPNVTAQKLAIDILRARAEKPIRIRSSAFAANGSIPVKYSDYGKGISPPLEWGRLPAGTKSFLLMMEDPDATSPLPFVHWIALGSAEMTGLREAVPPFYWPQGFKSFEQGSNSRSTPGYFGPRPPPGSGVHRYHFQIFALDVELRLASGVNRHAVLKAAKGHVLAKGEMVGTFRKAP
jgi:Raf kinase inhibitor-like YbhB/YbcL family protein